MELVNPDLEKTYTYADYMTWTWDKRVELINGKVYEIAMPDRQHQELSSFLHVAIGNYLARRRGKVYSAPFDVRIPRKSKDDKDIITVVQPDICVICDRSILDERGCLGAPDIVVEILSPSNNKKELRYKYEIYEEAAVKEYWVVFPKEKSLLMYTLTNGRYAASPFLYAGDTITSAVLPGFSLDLTLLFASSPDAE